MHDEYTDNCVHGILNLLLLTIRVYNLSLPKKSTKVMIKEKIEKFFSKLSNYYITMSKCICK